MAEKILQRLVMPLRRRFHRLYYRSNETAFQPSFRDRQSFVLTRGTILRTDTWFNSFFESYWRENTTLSQLVFRIGVSGAGTLRIYRRCSLLKKHLLREIDFSGQARELYVELTDDNPDSRNSGLLFCEIHAHSSHLAIHRAEWAACQVVPRPVRLVAGFCTFNRASRLIRNVAALLADPAVSALLDRILVVDQGTERVRDDPDFAAIMQAAAGRLHVLEQENRGGAGGFTRCLLEAQNTGSATHVLLMDDDIIPEPESVLRAAAFLSLARGELAVGGHMLDRWRPHQLVETGSQFQPERVRINEPSRCRLDRLGDVMPFLEPQVRHYNGWWFFAFSLAVLKRVGLPLPLFLRGDDVEFGCRLLRQGIATVTLPGVAVWHEPFERKGRGWHAYYELRNLLIVGALHFPIVRAATVARRFVSRVLDELLAYDYYEAWLMCEAAAAYLRGPDELRRPPLVIHDHLRAMAEKLGVETHPCDSTSTMELSPSPKRVPRFARIGRWWLVLRNLLRASPSPDVRPQRMLSGNGEQWYDVACADVVGVVEPHRSHLVLLRRSRARFIRLFLRSLWLALRLLLTHRRAVREWRAGAALLTSQAFWRHHVQSRQSFSEPRPSGSGGKGRVEPEASATFAPALTVTGQEPTSPRLRQGMPSLELRTGGANTPRSADSIS